MEKKMLDFPSEHFSLTDILYFSELKKSNALLIKDKYARMQLRIRYPAFSFLTHKSTSWLKSQFSWKQTPLTVIRAGFHLVLLLSALSHPTATSQTLPIRQALSVYSCLHSCCSPWQHWVIALQPHLHSISQKRQVQHECSKCLIFALIFLPSSFFSYDQTWASHVFLSPWLPLYILLNTFGPLRAVKCSLWLDKDDTWGQQSSSRWELSKWC